MWLLLIPIRVRGIGTRSEMALDIQTTRHRLVVICGATTARIISPNTGLDTAFDLQTARHCLVVIATVRARFNVSFGKPDCRSLTVIAGGASSTKVLIGSTEEEQFCDSVAS